MPNALTELLSGGIMTNRKILAGGTAALLACAAAAMFSPHISASTVAQTPPMGWDSYDSYGAFVNQQEVEAAANYMATNLKQYGYDYIVVDYDWAWTQPQQGAIGSGTTGSGYLNQTFNTSNGVTTASPPLEMNSSGQLLPDPSRFPSSINAQGQEVGFTALAAYVHSLGLKFGIHIMRGIPRQAVFANDPVAGSSYTASQIADTGSTAPWLNQMYGLDTNSAGTQLTTGAKDYYNSLFKMYASWGVDYVKVDDMLSTTYHAADVAGIQQAVANSGRTMVVSLSPGPAPITQGTQLSKDANMWRIDNDMWDNWSNVNQIFSLANQWTPYRSNGHWPDADMLPLGTFINPPVGTARTSQLTADQQRTVITLWSIIKSPLIIGGDLPSLSTGSFTTSLLTNSAVLNVDQNSTNNHQVSDNGVQTVWEADSANSPDKYVALFNRASSAGEVGVNFSDLGLSTNGTYDITNLWSGADLGNFTGSFSQNYAAYASGIYLIAVPETSAIWLMALAVVPAMVLNHRRRTMP